MGKQQLSTPRFPIFHFMNIKKSLPIIILLKITVIISMTTTAVGKFEEDRKMIDSTEFQSNYESFNNVLQSFSNVNGSVDYTSIRNNPYNLDIFITFINIVSPISHPELFSEADEKAYWINVYNALAIKTIIDNPNVNSIREISWGMGAFWRNKFVVGGKKMTLSHIEHKILRKKYKDPRIHFAINCASNSCPPIGNRIVTGDNLDNQLDKKASSFINHASNVRFDHANKEIHLSRIFKWFKKDFTQNNGDLLLYISTYHNDISTKQQKELISTYQIVFNKYDWALND
jgi:hypothetical protein